MVRLALAALAALLLLAACAEKETYPISGEQCGPEDPVRDMDVAPPC